MSITLMPNRNKTKKRKTAAIIMNVCICTTMATRACTKNRKRKKKKKTHTKKRKTCKKRYCLQHSFHFSTIKCYECHRIAYIWDVRCVRTTLRFVFMSKAHFLWLRFFIIRIPFVLVMWRMHTLSIYVHWLKWQETKMRCSFVSLDDGICAVRLKRHTRFHSRIVPGCSSVVWAKVRQH